MTLFNMIIIRPSSMLLQMAGRREEKTTKGWLFSLWQSSVHPSMHLQMAWRRREE
jgi:hypothetical protein